MKHFTFTEFERSETAYRYAIDNSVPDKVKDAIAALVDNVLDPLREAWGRPLRITSGYRCPELNNIVNGVGTSHHLRGMAADITTGNSVDNRRLFDLARRLNLPYTQLIGEKNFTWLHISFDPDDNRHQTFTQ